METNGLDGGHAEYHAAVTNTIEKTVDWTTPGLKIIRLRLLSDPGFPAWDVSYCHGQLPSGEYVNVGLPFSQLLKHRKTSINKEIIKFAKRDGLFVKPTGIFDAISTLC